MDTGEFINPGIVNSMGNVQKTGTGKDMFLEFVSGRIEKASKPLSDVVSRTNVYTFNNIPFVDLNKGVDKLGSAKANASLIIKLFMSLQARPDANMDDFFRH